MIGILVDKRARSMMAVEQATLALSIASPLAGSFKLVGHPLAPWRGRMKVLLGLACFAPSGRLSTRRWLLLLASTVPKESYHRVHLGSLASIVSSKVETRMMA